jgi:acyl carrier protein
MKVDYKPIIFKVIEAFIQHPLDEKKEDLIIIEELGIESIQFVDLMFEIERQVKIQIDLTDLSDAILQKNGRRFNSITVNDINDYLNSVN